MCGILYLSISLSLCLSTDNENILHRNDWNGGDGKPGETPLFGVGTFCFAINNEVIKYDLLVVIINLPLKLIVWIFFTFDFLCFFGFYQLCIYFHSGIL